MKYALLIYRGTYPAAGSEAWNAISAEEKKALYAGYAAFNRLPGVDPGLPFGAPEAARTVLGKGGKAEVREGFYLSEGITSCKFVEADSMEAAVAVAQQIPAVRLGGAVEIRPVEAYW